MDNAEEIKLPEEVYKSCQAKWIVTLAPLADTVTTLNRDNVADVRFAKFRGNKFMVVSIEDKIDPTIITDSVSNSCYAQKRLIYKTGEVVEVEDYDVDSNIVCSTGIHFFLSREAARCYEGAIKNGKRHGSYITYYDNGNKNIETVYVNGILHGYYAVYNENGNKWIESAYVDGKRHGHYITYTANGVMIDDVVYENGTMVADREHQDP
jgi:hypothetical protein